MTNVLGVALPRVLAILCDGNRRYAKKHGKDALFGHTEGLGRNTDRIERAALKAGIFHVVFFWASEANFVNRPGEVPHACTILQEYLRKRMRSQRKVGFHLLGQWERYVEDPSIRELADRLENKTAQYTERQVTICFGYDGQREIVEGVKSYLQAGGSAENISPEAFEKHLWTAHVPDVDFVIRTGCTGDPHLSAGFLMWKSANAQLYFTDTLWPEFTREHLLAALADYARRKRRLGA